MGNKLSIMRDCTKSKCTHTPLLTYLHLYHMRTQVVYLLWTNDWKVSNCSFSNVAIGTLTCLASPFILLWMGLKCFWDGMAGCCRGSEKVDSGPSRFSTCLITGAAVLVAPFYYLWKGLQVSAKWVGGGVQKMVESCGTNIHEDNQDYINPKCLEEGPEIGKGGMWV